MKKAVLHTSICDLLGIEYPIFLAGMGPRGRATPPALVAAVSNAGGLGVLGGSGLSPEEIRQRIREIKSLTSRPFGVNLLLPAKLGEAEDSRSDARTHLKIEHPRHVAFVQRLMREFNLPEVYIEDEAVLSSANIRAQFEVLLEEKVAVFSVGLGDPSWAVPPARKQNMKVIGLAGSLGNALRQLKAGVDIVAAQGYEAGGHTGKIASFVLLPQVVDAVKPVPVLAAGGIADGRGVAAALAFGAVGAWVGTAFLVANECTLPDALKEQLLNGVSRDFVITTAYTGKPARLYNNAVIEAWERSGLEPLPTSLQRVLMEDLVESAARVGRFDLVNNPAGQIAGMLKERKPANQILADLVEEAVEAIEGMSCLASRTPYPRS